MKSIFLLSGVLCLVTFSGCASEFNLATQKEESLMYGTDKEVAVGDSMSQQMEKNFKVNTDVDVNQRVQAIMNRLTPVSDRKDIVYIIRVLNEDELNAVSLPGGYIYVFKGLMDAVKNDDQLAGVIAHEMGHITARHAIKRMQASYSYLLLQILSVASSNGAAAAGVNAAYTVAFYGYSQEDELEADRLAVKYTKAAGYDPKAMLDVMRILKEKEEKEPPRPFSYFRTHPYLTERSAMLNTEIRGQMQYRDYLNLTGNKD